MAQSIFGSASRRRQFSEGLLDWACTHLDRFTPPDESKISNQEVAQQGRGRERKAFCELGLTLRLMQQDPWLTAHPRYSALKDGWLRMIDDQEVFRDIEGRQILFSHRIVCHASLSALRPGAEAQRLESFARVLQRGYVAQTERYPWQSIDLSGHLEAARIQHGLADRREVLNLSALARRPALSQAQDLDLYAVTHIVFALAQFGRVPRCEVAGQVGEDGLEYIRLALAMSMARRDCDLCAEFLLCRLYCGATGGVDALTAAWLLEAQRPDGALPVFSDRPGRNPDSFWNHYHPTLVGLILAAADAAAHGECAT